MNLRFYFLSIQNSAKSIFALCAVFYYAFSIVRKVCLRMVLDYFHYVALVSGAAPSFSVFIMSPASDGHNVLKHVYVVCKPVLFIDPAAVFS